MKTILTYIRQIKNKQHRFLVFASNADKQIVQSNIFQIDGSPVWFMYNKADNCYYQCD